jgi:hypothetical protein
MYHRLTAKVTISIIIMVALISLVAAQSISTYRTGTVAAVIDGSTFQLSSQEAIKLAAINTPSLGQAGYLESKNYLITLIQGKTVYLDTGITSTTDQQGRLLCTVYIDFNSTHFENINMAMVQNGYAVPNSTVSNGFDPRTWTWFVLKQTSTSPTATIGPQSTATVTSTPFSPASPTINPSVPELSTNLTVLIMAMITVLVASQLYKKRKK